jgi:hypothetical protein
MRRMLTAVYLFGASGILMELILMEHTEGVWQWIPILLVGSSVLLLVAHLLWQRRWALRGFQMNMILVLLAAILGIWLHFDGKSEFQLEMNPELSGWDLVWECIHGHSLPPVLAPGSMMLLGLVGMVGVYRHPLLQGSQRMKPNPIQ